MEHLVLYRKYRPKTFKEVIGQEHVVKTLTNALRLERLAHAYIFAGCRGTGKTTLARLLAKAVNCQKRTSFEPCNRCASCRAINEGRSLDLVEIDAASNRGIDEIRELRAGVKFRPSELKYKFFIIDEVHQLTREAFNALLKTLEEPPAHAIFTMATTEIHKVLPTVISRCQRFDLQRLTIDQIVRRLAWIAKQENVDIEAPALHLIAVNADGAVRDGESLLDQVMAMQDKHITLEEVKSILGFTDMRAVYELVEHLLNKQSGAAIKQINAVYTGGYDLTHFNKMLVDYLRKMLVLKINAGLVKLAAAELTKEQVDVIIKQSGRLSQPDLVRIINLFVRAGNEIRSADLPQLPLELAAVESCEE